MIIRIERRMLKVVIVIACIVLGPTLFAYGAYAILIGIQALVSNDNSLMPNAPASFVGWFAISYGGFKAVLGVAMLCGLYWLYKTRILNN